MGYQNYCSPNNTNNKFSCFSNESLMKIAKVYNNIYSDKITIPKKQSINKESFWSEIRKKLNKKSSCKYDYCWLDLPMFKELNIKQLTDSLRPKKPKEWNIDNNTWLSTIDIENVLFQYEINSDFKFIGAVPIDFNKELFVGLCVVNELCNLNIQHMYLSGIRKLGVVFNLDPHDKPGSHWVALYADFNNGGIYYFDSYGKPPSKEVSKLMEQIRVMGNKLIDDGFIDFNVMNHEHKVVCKYTFINNKQVKIKADYEIKLDTPINFTIHKDNTTFDKTHMCRVINIKKNNQYNILTFDRDIDENILTENRFLVQLGFRKFYNNIRFQYFGSECGIYSIWFITELLENKSFYDIITNIIDDSTINTLRNYYYRPNNNNKQKMQRVQYDL